MHCSTSWSGTTMRYAGHSLPVALPLCANRHRWMADSSPLIQSLRALAAPATVQLGRHPDFVVVADELALDYAYALLLVLDCRQIELNPEQRRALDEVDTILDEMSGAENANSGHQLRCTNLLSGKKCAAPRLARFKLLAPPTSH